jgi:flagellar biosynthesis protein FlhF
VAEDYQSALQQVKREMGLDAIILSSREIRKWGFLSFLFKPRVEVTVAVDDDIKIERDSRRQVARPAEGTEALNSDAANAPAWYGELAVMRQLVEQINTKMDLEQFRPHSEEVGKWYQVLLKNRLESVFAQDIAREVDRRITSEQTADADWIKKLFRLHLEDRLPDIKPIAKKVGGGPAVIFMVGPTGVGKTTTIAKLTAKMALEEKKNVALVTLDTYRIAAADQLKTYADIIQVPVQVALNGEELCQALNAFGDRDVIFVDTAGRSPFHEEQMQELDELVRLARPDETILVLSVTMNYEDMVTHYALFAPLLIDKIIFTKFDETKKIGGAINLLLASGKPLAYVANGQNVPDDLAVPDKLSLIQVILAEET